MSGLNGPAAIVQDKYSKSFDLAERASSAVAGFQSALNASVYAAPTISLAWATVAAPSLASIPNMPVLPTPTYQEPGGRPSSLAPMLVAAATASPVEKPAAINSRISSATERP